MPKFTKSEIENKIIEKGEKLEGVLYFDIEQDSYSYSIDKYTLAMLMKDVLNGTLKDMYYFKCTKSGKLTQQKVY